MASRIRQGRTCYPGQVSGATKPIPATTPLRAHLGDVFIRPASRGLGLGKALIETILAHPELPTVWHWTLTTADAHGLYAKYGFRPGEADSKWMTLDRTPHDEGLV